MEEFQDMLKCRKWAVAGATDNKEKFGYKVYRCLLDHGYTVYPIHPKLKEIDGHLCYASLEELPEKPDVVDFVVSPKIGEQTIRECAKLGIRNVWLQPGADAESVVRMGQELGLKVVCDCVLVRLGNPEEKKVADWSEFIKDHFNLLPYFQFMHATILDTARGKARVRLPVKPEYSNTYGIAHGGIVTSLIDMASGAALRTLKLRIVTLEETAKYFKPVMLDDVLTAEAQMTQEGRKILHVDVNVFNQDHVRVAKGNSIYYVHGPDSEENYDLKTFQSLKKYK